MQVQMRPTQPVLALCDLLDGAIEEYLLQCGQHRATGEFEAEVYCDTMMSLLIRFVEGVLELARSDLVLLPPAFVLARSSYETALRGAWVLKPSAHLDRESRWLSTLGEEQRFYEDVIAPKARPGSERAQVYDVAARIHDFKARVREKLPPGTMLHKQVPSMKAICEELGPDAPYEVYRFLSQYTHSTYLATRLYVRHLGTSKRSGEFIDSADWGYPLNGCWYSLFLLGHRLLEACGSRMTFPSPELTARFYAAREDLKGSAPEG